MTQCWLKNQDKIFIKKNKDTTNHFNKTKFKEKTSNLKRMSLFIVTRETFNANFCNRATN